MNLGTAQIEITPDVGAELSGFAVRRQPSTGVLDRLFARALYLVDGPRKFLWIHCDLIGFDEAIVRAFRDWAGLELGLAASQIMLSATHTHAGPGTLRLAEAGGYDDRYITTLLERLRAAAREAMQGPASCGIVTAEGRLELAVHRRQPASAHTDPRVGAVGFKRADGSFAAVIVNCAIHPVALGYRNRRISADLFGPAADELARELPGHPVVLVTNGACGNLNPPAINVSSRQMNTWGRQIGRAAIAPLLAASAELTGTFQTAVTTCRPPLEVLNRAEITAYAEKTLSLPASPETREWRAKLGRAVGHWRQSLTAAIDAGRQVDHREIEVFAVRLGDLIFVGANAELFSNFTDWVRTATGLRVYTVGYANGDWGYICPRPAYAEGGYEVEAAHLFYGGDRFQIGGLEQLADCTTALLKRDFAGTGSRPSQSTAQGGAT